MKILMDIAPAEPTEIAKDIGLELLPYVFAGAVIVVAAVLIAKAIKKNKK